MGVRIVVGVLSALVLGVGMCYTMVRADTMFIPGIFIGIVGIVGVITAYPIYTCITKKHWKNPVPEIIRLSTDASTLGSILFP